MPRKVEGEAAPAAADVEHRLAGTERELGGDVALFGPLRVLETVASLGEISARILPVGVEEEIVELA